MARPIADVFDELPEPEQRRRATIACEMLIPVWEKYTPDGEGHTFCLPEAAIANHLARDTGVRVVQYGQGKLEPVLVGPLRESLRDAWSCENGYNFEFDQAAMSWAFHAYLNLVRAVDHELKVQAGEVPHDNPYLLVVNQAVTAICYDARPLSIHPGTESEIPSELLEDVIAEWWEKCEMK